MHISETTVRRPVLAAVISMFLVLIGLVAYDKLSIREYPDIDKPVVTVSTIYLGASAEIVERDITQILEDSLSGISDIKEIKSESKDEISSIRIEFNLSRDMESAANDVREKVSRAIPKLPKDSEQPRVAKSDTDARAILWIGFTSNQLDSIALNDYLDRNIIDRLSILPGVASITVGGERKYAIRIWLDADKMSSRQITVDDILYAINKENIEKPAGRLDSIDREMSIQVKSKLSDVSMFNDIVLKSYDGKKIRLGDVAEIIIGAESDRGFLRANNKNAIGLGVVRQTKSNVLKVASAVKKELDSIRPTLPNNIDMFIGYDQSIFVNESIYEVRFALLISILMVIGVIYYFLSSSAATFIPAITIPVSLISTFYVIYVLGYSLNVLTFLALVLAIGLIVDDSIVVLENIKRRIENGENSFNASIEGAKQITFVVIATTLVLVAVFLPLSFMGGKTGKLFIEFGVVLSFAVIFSSIVALTLTPMLCSKLLIGKEKPEPEPDLIMKFRNFYKSSLIESQKNPKKVYLFSIIMVIVSAFLFQVIQKELAPTEDRGIFIISVTGPEGSSLDYTDSIVRQVEKTLEPYVEYDEINTVFSIVAPGFSGKPGEVNSAFMFTTLTDWGTRRHQKDIVREIFPQLLAIPGARVFAINPPSLGGSRFTPPVQLVISGNNYEDINKWGNTLIMESSDLKIRNSNIDYKITSPRLNLKINRDKAYELGVSAESIARTMETLLASNQVTTFSKDGLTYNVILQADKKFRVNKNSLDNIYIKSINESLIPLSNLVTYDETSTSQSLKRINRMPSTIFSASLAPGYPLGDALRDLIAISNSSLPANAKITFSGSSKEYFESGRSLEITILFAILIVYLVLAAQFESFRKPLAIILTVPIALTAGLYTLFLTGASINVYSQIGFLMLIGLITKNGILVVEFANQLREEGMSTDEAIFESSLIRLRPVLMTTISTLLGAVPLVLSSGAGAESRYAMAIVVLGGITLSSLITLYLVPALYRLLENR
ncbi:MAG: efflux RND transporter permease subunit [Gammaproteobacteria bacterium]|jgi:multidrug efflux pump|nr:efflux RND transporter permease subunit [Gammaproteobacteria bacterium]MBT5117309.1 efflux RND transporter permease subunit [Gammaproteobacteria bacterium]MBT6331504.1 efflux RND transporter permease subunit [Gammaproteobacteria bacterium]MBT7932549.1 efflux RND transporter permease subunit [Gammaproteobacteria bacterium]MDG2159167.1 efflux RND transporter permease subunit [Gammaproteobacteria bacterium]